VEASSDRTREDAPRARVIVAPDAEAMSVRAAAELAEALAADLAAGGGAHVALSGGNTPVRTYELLAESVADWRGVELWFADERCVGPHDAESNYRLVAEALVAHAHARGGADGLADQQVHRMEGELGPWAGAEHYAEVLRSLVAPGDEGVAALDTIVLGIGGEGHIASLFPDAAALRQTDVLCLGVADSPKPPPERITLSLPVLRAARRCVLLASGEAKAQALAAALAGPSQAAPASLLPAARLTVIADEAAASALGIRGEVTGG
jgi:6-phosphogluconolactonase